MHHTTVTRYSFSMTVKQLVNIVTVSGDATEEVSEKLLSHSHAAAAMVVQIVSHFSSGVLYAPNVFLTILELTCGLVQDFDLFSGLITKQETSLCQQDAA